MTIETLIIPVAFILVAVGLAWFVIYAKGWWWAKCAYMAIVVVFGLMVWNSIESYRGWPTNDPTPQRFIMLWAEIKEPEPKIGFTGAIYIWLLPYEADPAKPGPLNYSPEAGEPRAHKLPYSRKVHEQLEAAKEMIKAGQMVMMERRKGKSGFGKSGESGGKGSIPGEKDGQGRGKRPGGHEAEPYDEFFFYQMPPPALPGKPDVR